MDSNPTICEEKLTRNPIPLVHRIILHFSQRPTQKQEDFYNQLYTRKITPT